MNCMQCRWLWKQIDLNDPYLLPSFYYKNKFIILPVGFSPNLVANDLLLVMVLIVHILYTSHTTNVQSKLHQYSQYRLQTVPKVQR